MFDFGIVGGGMVGSAVAVGLAKKGYKVALVERQLPKPFKPSQLPDMRVSAINIASQNLLNELGAWEAIKNMRLCPFSKMEVWESTNAKTGFDSTDIQREYLGHIIENRLVQIGLLQQIAKLDNVSVFSDSNIMKIDFATNYHIELDNSEQIFCEYLVGADGANSQVRQFANIGTQGWQYKQQALGIKVKMGQQQDITWQAFKSSGPLAFLPLYDGFASLVWYDSVEKIKQLKSLSVEELKVQIINDFPKRLEAFEILETASFPLTRMHANQYIKDNIILIGDAAHTINPLAGQGVNLGFKDVSVLLNETPNKDNFQSAIMNSALLRYQKRRRLDNAMMMSTMDAIYSLFSNDLAPLSVLRNAGLALADKMGPIKHKVMRYAMGID